MTPAPTSAWLDIIEVVGVHWITKRWSVTTKRGLQLGVVAYFPKWRQFTFQPYSGERPMLDAKCLQDLADFVTWANGTRTVERAQLRAGKPGRRVRR